ncbi:hypothetical protein N7539_004155 [Penicillium diatomitis]|uniref:Tyrosine specific protein phosphatases domain-containing protein n=1 Tax=Penicillium diatomitis TaxID=2819901 RepID=A0A9X0BXZ1_9EURO|nr:uncharacterized protein N7539_004155 [Penicillium diatomitis]KAJ5489265.1 hypothetical protein N7539_004155 [Penicillium diatomitis]
MSTFVTVEGVPNVRDIGGYACAPPVSVVHDEIATDAQWTIRTGLLFRAAQPSQITVAGVDTLTKTLGIQAVFDFRSESEIDLVRQRYPNSLLDIPGTTRHAVPVFQAGDYSPVSLAKKYGVTGKPSESERDQQVSRPGFVKAYEAIARSAAQTGSFRAIMQHLLHDPAAAILFHCTVGKDRTGVFSALILRLCGVADEDIVADYALTTQGLGVWREHLIARLLQKGDATTREQAEAVISSDPTDMSVFLRDVVDAEFGGARKYFTDLCGIPENDLDQIISRLVKR